MRSCQSEEFHNLVIGDRGAERNEMRGKITNCEGPGSADESKKQENRVALCRLEKAVWSLGSGKE